MGMFLTLWLCLDNGNNVARAAATAYKWQQLQAAMTWPKYMHTQSLAAQMQMLLL